MNTELSGALIAMIFGTVWVAFGFGSALLVGLIGIVGYLVAKYSKVIFRQALDSTMAALNIERK
ncbi:hypothetical protein [Lentilactobacillus kosonis]|uniref:DUF2273 domain-containing protein n=1 Tax=Lentilactobacillus kosonis TaxID=2810561 RepID=A0A401FIE0_9LACO|nr:hypothetical protein [Lentilactobacillus kosonis]GAY72066.1 hypothetical protein NBRC111893_212 [Lentilactobacillus kosonis]